ncbi:unnamed protein product [Taenia asiatica]|uniref:RDD domain-containing protein n=1 Tax=Taenia asiatica TaxID=60517 RepID=A0A0R3W650_TAEAS|nr:unnamed protein product [Taenia asiatica]
MECNGLENLNLKPHFNFADARFRLPSLKSRLMAEVIDTLIVFILKFYLVYLMEDPDGFHKFVNSLTREILNFIPGYRIVMTFCSMTQIYLDVMQSDGVFDLKRFHEEVMFASRNDPSALSDAISLLLCLIFEVYFVSKSAFDFEPGGCSLGKYLMDLRVLSCSHRINLPDAVDIIPAGNPGICRSIIRAILKNSGISIWSSLLQIALTGDPVFSYDLLAGTIVVQLPEIAQSE